MLLQTDYIQKPALEHDRTVADLMYCLKALPYTVLPCPFSIIVVLFITLMKQETYQITDNKCGNLDDSQIPLLFPASNFQIAIYVMIYCLSEICHLEISKVDLATEQSTHWVARQLSDTKISEQNELVLPLNDSSVVPPSEKLLLC